MRVNLPVTNEEYTLPEDEVIVTRTDDSSHITYANEAFLTSSGFTMQECLGQPQNIVRHPDMPPAAFEDMWATIRKGLPWTGIVKNRRKNGGFYWVRANVTPIVEQGRITGFMSVRTRPSTEEVRAADGLYRRMREGNAKGIRLRGGEVVRRGVLGILQRLAHPSLAQWTWGSIGTLGALFCTLAVLAVVPVAGLPAWVPAAVAVAGALLALGVAAHQQRSIVAPINGMRASAVVVLGGDIRAKFPQKGNREVRLLGHMLAQMNAKVVGVMLDTRACLDRMVAGAREISAGNLDLSKRTEEQAASLQQTAASMEELTSTVRQNTDNAVQAHTISDAAADVATRGGEAAREVVASMEGIATSSRKIADIIGVIDSIAFQTNILALNAAVEAARAGDQGRGFAVVASEVRALAQRSATAAKEIKDLITESVRRVEGGFVQVESSGLTMQEVVASVRQLKDIMGDIASASKEQSAGIDQVNVAVSQMDRVTQQNAALVEQVAATSEELLGQANRVVEATSAFNFGRNAALAPAPAKAERPGKPTGAGKSSPAAARPQRKAAPAPVARPHQARMVANGEPDWEEF